MKSTAPSYLKHHFLIAMPQMADPNFAQTLIYLIEHGPEGAMGLIVNRPSGLSLADVLEQLRRTNRFRHFVRACLSSQAARCRPTAASSCIRPSSSFRRP